jgi:hypothetical protein
MDKPQKRLVAAGGQVLLAKGEHVGIARVVGLSERARRLADDEKLCVFVKNVHDKIMLEWK